MGKPLRVLIINDSEAETPLLVGELQRGGYDSTFEQVVTARAMISALQEKPWDLVACDYDLPKFSALAALKLVAESKLDLPFIILSGAVGDDAALVTIQDGAYHYVMEDNLGRLIPAITSALSDAQLRRERRQAEKTLQESETKYRQLVENLQEGIWVVDRDARTTYINPRLLEMLGYSSEEMLGKALFSFMDKDSVELCQRNLERRKQGIKAHHDFEFLRKDGTRVFAHLETSLITDSSGNYNGALVAVEDITERRQAEELFRTLAESSPIGIFIVQDGQFQYTNPQFQKATGYTEYELPGMNSLTFVHPEDKDLVRDNAISMLKNKRTMPYEYRIIDKAGETRWVMETVTSILYRRRRAVLGNYLDITERKQLERKMYEYEELNRLKTNLLSTVSHELRTPLATIKGYATMILDYDRRLGQSEKRDYLKSIDHATDRLTELIDHLLDMSRLEAGLLKLQKTPTDISHLIREVVSQARPRMRTHGIVLRISKPLPLVNIDARRIWQVLDNIIDNAAKYSGDGTDLVISARRDGTGVVVSVADQGIGIPADELGRVFDRFYRIEHRLNPDVKGFGLGLAICRGLVQAHGSQIWVESQVGKGSTFFFTLPLADNGEKHSEQQAEEQDSHRCGRRS